MTNVQTCKTPNSLRNSQVSQSLQYRLIWNLKPRFSVVSGTFEARLFILTDFILINLTSSSVNSQTDCMFHFAAAEHNILMHPLHMLALMEWVELDFMYEWTRKNILLDCMFHFAGLIRILDYSRYYIL